VHSSVRAWKIDQARQCKICRKIPWIRTQSMGCRRKIPSYPRDLSPKDQMERGRTRKETFSMILGFGLGLYQFIYPTFIPAEFQRTPLRGGWCCSK